MKVASNASELRSWIMSSVPNYDPSQHSCWKRNRSYRSRHDDHISFLKSLDVVEKGIFIDIGPGLANVYNQSGEIDVGGPAVTSIEMAKSFPEMKIILLETYDSICRFSEMENNYPCIGKEVRKTKNVSIYCGNGLLPLPSQLNQDNLFHGKEVVIDKDEIIVIRCSNSIDIYSDWDSELEAAISNLARDYISNTVVLFFYNKILVKEKYSNKLIRVGMVSDRGFNHRFRTHLHVPSDTPCFSLERDMDMVQLKKLVNSKVEYINPEPNLCYG